MSRENIMMYIAFFLCGITVAIVFFTFVGPATVRAGVADPDWPDWVICGTTWGNTVHTLGWHPASGALGNYYYYQQPGGGYARFNPDGTFASNDTNVSCGTNTIADRVTNGTAGNFGGGSGTSTTTVVFDETNRYFFALALFLMFFMSFYWVFRGRRN